MAERSSSASRRTRGSAIAKAVAVALLVSAVVFSGWTALKYFHYSSFQGYIRESIQFGLSNFQIEIAFAGLTGLLASLFFRGRRRSRRTRVRPLKMTPMTFGTTKPVHPLMMTPRPARDSKFVIRKTRNRGRISRNRMGERLPPSYVVESEIEGSA